MAGRGALEEEDQLGSLVGGQIYNQSDDQKTTDGGSCSQLTEKETEAQSTRSVHPRSSWL